MRSTSDRPLVGRALRVLLVVLIAAFTSVGGGIVARGGIGFDPGSNESGGDISSDTSQDGSAESGDAVGGQVVGVVSAGNTRVDATNRSEDVDVRSGDADAENCAAAVAGLVAADDFEVEGCGEADSGFGDGGAQNESQGDIEQTVVQAALVATGDAVGGQIIGVVTPGGGTSDLTLANSSLGVDAQSGDATLTNETREFVGQQGEEDGFIGGLILIGGLDFGGLDFGGLDFGLDFG